ncbi:hypothetical protein [Endozoicomonas numazuensis]|uniref:Uncharacterized protein n=1 Tax=Endozoicomonas numazuensis TaxID=1137799 RepID=A0A081NL72_9GAMM|nr:hypothetical protein [Endozoicomonas numazuensis]KEQ19195.1 hypothetical protein GZ78_04155 [Endozoicomonas numazuensis]
MSALEYFAIPMDETVYVTKKKSRSANEHQYTTTHNCPCDDCPFKQRCQTEALACAVFSGWVFNGKQKLIVREPSSDIYQKLRRWG